MGHGNSKLKAVEDHNNDGNIDLKDFEVSVKRGLHTASGLIQQATRIMLVMQEFKIDIRDIDKLLNRIKKHVDNANVKVLDSTNKIKVDKSLSIVANFHGQEVINAKGVMLSLGKHFDKAIDLLEQARQFIVKLGDVGVIKEADGLISELLHAAEKVLDIENSFVMPRSPQSSPKIETSQVLSRIPSKIIGTAKGNKATKGNNKGAAKSEKQPLIMHSYNNMKGKSKKSISKNNSQDIKSTRSSSLPSQNPDLNSNSNLSRLNPN